MDLESLTISFGRRAIIVPVAWTPHRNARQSVCWLNLTPHAVRLRGDDDLSVETDWGDVPASGVVARVVTTESAIEYAGHSLPSGVGARLYTPFSTGRLACLDPDGLELPFPALPGELRALVSLPCLDAARSAGMWRVYAPGTGPNDGAVRDRGQVVAVRTLVQACRRPNDA